MLKRITAFTDLSFTHRLSRAAIAGALALCCVGSLALAADDEEDAFETKVIKGILGINDGGSIDYRERPPLVVPPSRNLPTPGSAESINSPAWPKDPDVAERKRKKAAAAKQQRRSFEDGHRALTPGELDGPGRLARGTGGASPASPATDDFSQNRPLRPDELGNKGNIFSNMFKTNDKGETAVFTGEPPRTDLTQPPVGYLTPSPSYPYGLGTKKEAPKPYNAYENRGTDSAR